MWRTFGAQTLNGNAQPLLGDKLTAALAVPLHGIDPILTVANTAIYQDGDRITIDPLQTNQDSVLVTSILSPTTMQCTSQGATIHAHAVNAILQLDLVCAEVMVQAKSTNANSLFLGTDNTVTSAGGGNVVQELTPGGTPFRMTNSAQYNTVRTNDLWMAGTAAQIAIVAAQVI